MGNCFCKENPKQVEVVKENNLKRCQSCFDLKICKQCPVNCSRCYCIDCIQSFISVHRKDRNIPSICSCGFRKSFQFPEFYDEQLKERQERFKLEQKVLIEKSLYFCPGPNCSMIFIKPESNEHSMYKCLLCKYSHCIICKEMICLKHITADVLDDYNMVSKPSLNYLMIQKINNSNVKYIPKNICSECNCPIELIPGTCNIITCAMCNGYNTSFISELSFDKILKLS